MSSQPDINQPLTLLELVTLFRQLADDLPGDTVDDVHWQNNDTGLLWRNQEIVSYANQAEAEFCYRQPILDGSSALTQLAVTEAEQEYSYSKLILSVRSVQFLYPAHDCAYPLSKKTLADMDRMMPGWDHVTGASMLAIPSYYIEDSDHRLISLYHPPVGSGTLQLSVDRLPLRAMTWSARHQITPEIDPQHHYDLLDWMLHRAYQKRDSETVDPNRSAQFEQDFERKVGPRPSARLLRIRRQERNLRRRSRGVYL